jgi:hypothetical protein
MGTARASAFWARAIREAKEAKFGESYGKFVKEVEKS